MNELFDGLSAWIIVIITIKVVSDKYYDIIYNKICKLKIMDQFIIMEYNTIQYETIH